MSSVINEEDAVGYYMTATMVTGAKYEGTIFTYNPKEGVIVLMQDISGEQPSMKMIRTPFIKEYSVKAKVPNQQDELPPQLESFSSLPSMHVGRDKSIFKQASVQLKQAETQRLHQFENFDEDTPIAACDAFVRVARLYPDISWDSDDKVIRVTGSVIITGTPDWTTPVAELVSGAPEKEKSLVDRIQKALDGPSK